MSIEINDVAVVGAGYMGGGIAQSLALAGLQVQIADVDSEATSKAFERLLKEAGEFEVQGLYKSGSTAIIKRNLSCGESIEAAVANADFIEEAVFEVPDVKRSTLELISAKARPDAIIGTNTSTIPLHVLAPAVKHPDRFLTVHFSNPAPFIPGLSLIHI